MAERRPEWRELIEARSDELLAIAGSREDTATASPARIRNVRAGDLDALPATFRWETSGEVAHMINGYDLMPFEALAELAGHVLAEVRSGRDADIAPLDLWAMLFFQHRAYRHTSGEPEDEELQVLDRLCRRLREAIRRQDRNGRTALADAMRDQPARTGPTR